MISVKLLEKKMRRPGHTESVFLRTQFLTRADECYPVAVPAPL